MPTKGKLTREKIIAKSAPLFNQQGYNGASLSDIMAVTGLKKGGIYNHFSGKDELALAAFDYNWAILRRRYDEAMAEAGDNPADRLIAAIGVHAGFADRPPMDGGCPLLNTAIENDDGHPQLRQKAQEAFTDWHTLLSDIVADGIDRGAFQPSANPQMVATVIISTIEGGIMLGKLFQDLEHIRTAANHLYDFVRQHVLK
ncbi:MAG: TetR/AcrR family transcriptional regulator [Chloroflexota bacterium]